MLDTFGRAHRGNLLLEFTAEVADEATGETVSTFSRTLLAKRELDIGFAASECSIGRQFPSSVMVWVTKGDGSKLAKDDIKFGSFRIATSVGGVSGESPGVRYGHREC